MFKKVWISACLGLVCLLGLTPGLLAQESAIVQARAIVLPALSIVGTNDLNFEYVLPGIRKSVSKADVGLAGEWVINGSSRAEITLDFTLPDSLRKANGIAAMRVGFNPADASFDDGDGAGQIAPAGILNPYAISTRNLGTDGAMVIWIGGTVYPSKSQESGSYKGDIILTATYTGN
jgi:hypothetical protein